MAVRVGINGFGRIGRNVVRAWLAHRMGENIEFVAVNDLPVPVETLSHLLKYDSILGELQADVKIKDGAIVVNGKELKVFTIKCSKITSLSVTYHLCRHQNQLLHQ